MAIVTYLGKLRDGHVELSTPIDLPEGSEVYIVAHTGVDLLTAKRKANGWLVDHVGNLVLADDGVLIQQDNGWVWRFNAYVTSLTHAPHGPIGQIEVDANTGTVLSNQETIETLYASGKRWTDSA